MADSSSLTAMIHQLKAGNTDAANELWRKCYPRLVQHARKHLEGVPRRMADEEDVVISAIKSFCKAIELNRFPDLEDSDDLWRLLFVMTSRKSINLRRYEARRKALAESDLNSPDQEQPVLQNIPGELSEEDFTRRISEELDHKLHLLSPELQEIAIAKLEGYKNHELSTKLDVRLRTIERNLSVIREVWIKQYNSDLES